MHAPLGLAPGGPQGTEAAGGLVDRAVDVAGIRERYDETGDNTAAVAAGLQRTGGLITSLAFLLIIVVGLFSASGISFMKLLGVGMIVALLVDATVVRILLVPATMRLLGRANWWAPGPPRRLYTRYGIKEEDKTPVPVG